MFEIKCAVETKLSKPIIKFQYYDCEIQKCILGNAACQSKLYDEWLRSRLTS